MRRVWLLGGLGLAAHACIMVIPESPQDDDGSAGGGPCSPGSLVECYDGPAETLDEGLCRSGAAACQPDGSLAACTGQVLPALESCDSTDSQDEDCNGATNEHCAVWVAKYGGYAAQHAQSMVTTAGQAIFLLANNSGELDFGGGESFADQFTLRATVARLDASGRHIWSEAFGEVMGSNIAGGDIAEDPELGVFVVGSVTGDLVYQGTLQATGDVNSYDMFVARLDAETGAGLRFAVFGDTEVQNGYAVAAAPDGVVVAGTAAGSLDFTPVGVLQATPGGRDGVIAKLDADLTPLWARLMGGAGDDEIRRVRLDSDGNVYVAGWFATELDLGGRCAALTAAGDADAFVAKLSGEDGSCLWVHAFPGSGAEKATPLAYVGQLYVGVTFTGSISDGEWQGDSLGEEDILISVLDPETGASVQRRTFGAPGKQEIHDLAIDAAGFVAVVGSVGGSIDMGGGLMEVAETGASRQDDAYVMLLDPDLEHVFSRLFSGDQDDDAFAVSFREGDELLVYGEIEGTVDFGTGPLVSSQIDLFLLRLPR